MTPEQRIECRAALDNLVEYMRSDAERGENWLDARVRSFNWFSSLQETDELPGWNVWACQGAVSDPQKSGE